MIILEYVIIQSEFVTLYSDILPKNYYNSTLIGGRIDQQVFQSCIAWKLSKLHAVFKATDTLLEPILCPWFLCLYINVLPLYTVCRVWDCLFWEGSTVLFRIGLTMITSKSRQLLQATDFMAVYSILKCQLPGRTNSFTLESARHLSTGTGASSDDASGDFPPTFSTSVVATDTTSSSAAASGVTMSDTECLIHNAFGYKWIKFVPIEQIENLRRKFGELMDNGLDRETLPEAVPTPTSIRKKSTRLHLFGGVFGRSQSQSTDDWETNGHKGGTHSPTSSNNTKATKTPSSTNRSATAETEDSEGKEDSDTVKVVLKSPAPLNGTGMPPSLNEPPAKDTTPKTSSSSSSTSSSSSNQVKRKMSALFLQR